MKVIEQMKEKEIYDPALPRNQFEDLQRSFDAADEESRKRDFRMVEFDLPFPATIEDYGNGQRKLVVSVPLRGMPAPILSQAAMEAIVAALGKRDAAKVAEELVNQYYRQLVSRMM